MYFQRENEVVRKEASREILVIFILQKALRFRRRASGSNSLRPRAALCPVQSCHISMQPTQASNQYLLVGSRLGGFTTNTHAGDYSGKFGLLIPVVCISASDLRWPPIVFRGSCWLESTAMAKLEPSSLL